MPRAGRLDKRVLIERPVTAQTPEGSEVTAWQAVGGARWAAVEPVSGREALTANQLLATMSTRIVLRWTPTLDQMNSTWRIKHGALIYNIGQIVHRDMGHRELEVMVSSGANNG